MFNGKKKALTFSYDDGVTQDIRLIELFNKYGMKATFNLNSGLLGLDGFLIRNGVKVSHIKNKPEDVKHIYQGHEIAVHTISHPNLGDIADERVIIEQVEGDREALSELCGYEVRGMAYPCANGDERVKDIIKNNTKVEYARMVATTNSFEPCKDLYQYKGTLCPHKEWDKLFELGEEFLKLNPEEEKVFYIWGHAYEFDIFPKRWEIFEDFLKMMSGKNDIFYGTNIEVLK